ncbi:sugar O-acetyltransferase [Kineosporia sp. J2-2]|uniref:Sugar O-acetyltransferase n=1 Tax=Kineosporia corallincola TaxID=2835133 RepID=A0ABS5TGQ5_9ACTN|nr:sugar O-acetyltransferase [Kineosporia corallincola]
MANDEQEILARIHQGRIYSESEASFQAPRRRTELIFEYNHTPPAAADRRRELLVAILGSVGERTVLLPPFHAGFGSNVHIGDDFFGNVNLTLVDDVDIRIGDGVMIAPSVTLTTTGHPVHPDRRVDFARFSEPIVLEDKVWIGSNAVVLPGVRIGYGSVIGAGSVVSHDIPPMVVAVGTPLPGAARHHPRRSAHPRMTTGQPSCPITTLVASAIRASSYAASCSSRSDRTARTIGADSGGHSTAMSLRVP